MNAVTGVDSEAERLVALVGSQDAFDMPFAEALPRQLEAIDARFKDRVGKIKLLQNRAETGGVTEIRRMADIVPLLFAHTAYKSYPEGWLVEKKWDRLGRWLDTVSTHRVEPLDTGGIETLDDWLTALEGQGHYVSCSSGTTGKCAMMNASVGDLDFASEALVRGTAWGAGLEPKRDRRMISLGQTAATPRNMANRRRMVEAYNLPGVEPFAPEGPPVTIGGITEMVVLRKKIAEGVAKPAEIAHFEAQAAAREKAMEGAVEQAADALIESRHLNLHISGLFAPLYKVADLVRSRGYSGKDFSPENTGFIGGGLKRVALPPNYREFIFETLNLSAARLCQGYGMQELNTNAIRCKAGRYHMAPWVMLLLLDEPGETLIEPVASGEVEGRAAFFDISMEGRWGGLISGDKVRVTWEPCACGTRSPSVAYDIERYADGPGGDKISCSGNIDAYVRGVS
jgi:hypothetical protein